ncbi:hypothetical protein [Streptomyces fructofermentans]|uniref:Uncharacterized protein n=1 Tax=Streptomyces fructofermentans TaxID=152141 RepID=A0A918N6Q6_9ACTN|nr:hypothetical protein [Streptomyces fructofermentans]GGX47366.1 hypothetical protein GCM10010515_13040 [Streptomyces fructofermentans]
MTREPPPGSAPMTLLVRGFWCECWREDPTGGGPAVLLSATDAYSAVQADRWIAIALRTLASALDPVASAKAWDWLDEGRMETRRTLLRAQPCSVTVHQGDTRVTWTVRPALFLPLEQGGGGGPHACDHPVHTVQSCGADARTY